MKQLHVTRPVVELGYENGVFYGTKRILTDLNEIQNEREIILILLPHSARTPNDFIDVISEISKWCGTKR